MTANQLKKQAQLLCDKINALGFLKEGKAMVVDQAFELVAATQGFRNQHALRLMLTPEDSDSERQAHFDWSRILERQGWDDASQLSLALGFIEEHGLMSEFVAHAERAAAEENSLDVDSFKPVLMEVGYSVEQSDFGKPFWQRGDDGSEDFESEEAAWADAWEDAQRAAIENCSMPKDVWTAMPLEAQLHLVVEALGKKASEEEEVAQLKLDWGDEHDYYTRAAWADEVKSTGLKLDYWAWVRKCLVEDDDTNNCSTCGAPLDDGEGWDGQCGTCADKSSQPSSDSNERALADQAFEDYDFGEDYRVGAVNGWTHHSGQGLWTRSVFLEDVHHPDADSVKKTFTVEVSNGKIISVSLS